MSVRNDHTKLVQSRGLSDLLTWVFSPVFKVFSMSHIMITLPGLVREVLPCSTKSKKQDHASMLTMIQAQMDERNCKNISYI